MTTFFTPDTGADPAAVLAFFDALKAYLPSGVQVTVPNSGDLINDASGDLVGAWAEAGGGSVTGTSASVFILGTGVRIIWETAGFRNNRHVRGSTFIVPVVSTVFDASGRMTPASQAAFALAGTNLISASDMGLLIWSRPKPGVNGFSQAVTSARVSEQPSWLRSRRV